MSVDRHDAGERSDPEDVVAAHPDLAADLRAQARLFPGDAPGAEEDARRAVALGPSFVAARTTRAAALQQLGRFEEALREHDVAVRLAKGGTLPPRRPLGPGDHPAARGEPPGGSARGGGGRVAPSPSRGVPPPVHGPRAKARRILGGVLEKSPTDGYTLDELRILLLSLGHADGLVTLVPRALGALRADVERSPLAPAGHLKSIEALLTAAPVLRAWGEAETADALLEEAVTRVWALAILGHPHRVQRFLEAAMDSYDPFAFPLARLEPVP